MKDIKNNKNKNRKVKSSSPLQIPLFPLSILAFLLVATTLFVSPAVDFPKSETVEVKTSPVPINEGLKSPYISAQAAIVYNPDSAVVLFEKNPDLMLAPVSTTKMVTAIIALENVSPLSVVEVPIVEFEPQKMELFPGERIAARDLLYGILLWSANDAAEVLARSFPGGRENFINQMNIKAKELGMKNTHFTNPTGLPEQDHFSSARDLARFAQFAMENSEFAKMVGTKKITVRDIDGKTAHNLVNLNQLLGSVPGVLGIKTGWTEESGGALVTYIEREGKSLVIIVLGSQDRFGDSSKLIEWAYAAHTWDYLP